MTELLFENHKEEQKDERGRERCNNEFQIRHFKRSIVGIHSNNGIEYVILHRLCH